MENYLKGTVLPIWEFGPTNFGANALLPLKTSPRCKVAARPRPPGSSLQPVVRQRCCYAAVLLPIRHSKDDNNGGINEIIGTVWMITLLPLLNLTPIQLFFAYFAALPSFVIARSRKCAVTFRESGMI